MQILKGSVVARDRTGVWIDVRPRGCSACYQQCPDSAKPIHLPVSAEKEFLTSHIALSLSLRGQCALLFNSLLLPLFGFVLGLVLASHLALSEPVSVLCSFAGLGVGMMSCRRFDEHQLNVSEIPEDEVEDV